MVILLGDEVWPKGLPDIVNKIKQRLWARSKSFVSGWLKPIQMPPQEPIAPTPLKPSEEYVEIRLKSMRIPFERVLGRRYYGAVHSYISLDTLAGTGTADFNVVTTPTELQKVDPKNVSNVIQRDIPLLGRFPYIGHDISVQAGVFSIIEEDLVAPFLKIIEDISNVAGVDIVSKAMPFVYPIQNAIYSLIGYSGDNKIEVGIKMPLKQTGYLVAVGIDKSSSYLSKLKLGDDGRLYEDGNEIEDYAYMVLTIKTFTKRDNISKIPYLLKAHQDLQAGVGTGDKQTILELFNAFKRQVWASPDIIHSDKKTITDDCYNKWVKPYIGEAKVLREKRLIVKDEYLQKAEEFLKQFEAKKENS